jgi:hypothetical protein
MSNPALPQAKNRHRSGAANGTKSTDKNFCALYPRNSLISLDSDERIQGNPTPRIGAFRSEMAGAQENPNGSTEPTWRPTAKKEPNRPQPKANPP